LFLIHPVFLRSTPLPYIGTAVVRGFYASGLSLTEKPKKRQAGFSVHAPRNGQVVFRLARIIHERSIGLPLAYRKSAEYTGKVAYSQYFQLDTLKTEFPLFIN
jgi:hypothetical protein